MTVIIDSEGFMHGPIVTTSHRTKGLPKPTSAIEAAIATAEKDSVPECHGTGTHVCKFCGKEIGGTWGGN